MTEEAYWSCHPSLFSALCESWRRKQRRESARFAGLMALYANSKRNPEIRPEPFTMDDFLPPDPDKPKRPRRIATRRISAIMVTAFFERLAELGVVQKIEQGGN